MPQTKWEYHVTVILEKQNVTEELNKLGVNGWELVAILPTRQGLLSYFKRQRDA